MNFLEKVAEYILQISAEDLENSTLVLPGKRTSVFLKKELEKRMGPGQFFPNLITLQDWIKSKSNFAVPHPIRLQIELYETYCQEFPLQKESLSQFSKWSSILLADFNEMEKSMADSQKLLDHLKDFSDIDFWSTFLGEEEFSVESKIKQKHLEFWNRAKIIFPAFVKQLAKNNWQFPGQQLRNVAENIKNNSPEKGQVFLIGFNALSKAEEHIFDFYIRNKGAKILWDIDAKLFEDEEQEAGFFMRKYYQQWKAFIPKDFLWKEDYFSKQGCQFELIPADGTFQQMSVVAKRLDSWNKDKINLTKIAHVFCDEKSLLPFLNRLPKSIPTVNITMGYPLHSSIAVSFIDHLFTILQDTKKKISLRDLSQFLQHPFFSHLPIEQYLSKAKNNRVWSEYPNYWKDHFLSNELEDLAIIFPSQIDGKTIWEIGFKLINIAKNNPQLTSIQKELLFSCYTIWVQVATIYQEFPQHSKDTVAFHQFIRKIASKENLDFIGDPVSGLQIMGMLETRLLDFDNLLFSGINEGVMPKGKTGESFIPFELKKHYGMNTHIENDAVYAYHFFRLLQRAKKVLFVYNSHVDTMGGGQMSRFLLQMQKEWPYKGYLQAKQWTETKPQFNSNPIQNNQIIEKTPDVKAILLQYAKEKPISISYINSYLRDPVNFYQERVLKARELDTDPILGHNELGSIVHNTLENLYNQDLGRVLTLDIIDKYLEQIPNFFEKEVNLIGGKSFFAKADNIIRKEVALAFVYQIVREDKKTIKRGEKLRILHNELSINIEYPVPFLDFPFQFTGSIDRIDELDGTIRILDYKTGKFPLKTKLDLKNYTSLLQSNPTEVEKHSQLLFYWLLIHKKELFKGNDMEIGLWFSRQTQKNPIYYLQTDLSNTEDLEIFEDCLKEILYSIFISDDPFVSES